MNIYIKNGFLITANKNGECYEGCVHVMDDVISYVGSEENAPEFNADRIIDANGGIIAPGFVNTHTHIPMNLFRSAADDMELMDWLQNAIWPAEDRLTGDDIYWGSMLGMAELIAGGVTCFNDMYGFASITAKAANEIGMRALIGAAIIDIDNRVDERIKEAEQLFEQTKNYKLVKAAIAPHAEYTVCQETFKKTIKAANKLKSRIHIHISETKGEHEDSIKRNGKTPIEVLKSVGVLELPTMAAHCVWVSDSDMDIMARFNVGVMSCPQSNLKLGSGIARIADMIEKGITVSCATDGAGSNNNLSMMEEMTYMAMLQKGTKHDPKVIPAKTAVETATINGAKVLGLEKCIGSLETGKQADLIILDTTGIRYCPRANLLNNFVYSGSDSDVVLTMISGEILYENGKFHRIDIEEVKANANRCAKRLLG